MERACDGCGQPLYRKASDVNASNFCSRECYDAERRERASSYPKVGERHEHRIVAERKLGRPLRPGEVVHHVDGDKRNNAPSNIEVLASQREHIRLHRPSRWRREARAPSRT